MLLLSLILSVVAPMSAPTPAPCVLAPVDGPVVDPFRDPGCTWCPGNRGLTYATVPDSVVRAAAGGAVTFSGTVAGTRYLVVEHPDGVRATYGGLSDTPWRIGDVVGAGAVVGRAGPELHFGLRMGDRYLDPAPRIGRVVERPRLVPMDGTAARPAPPPTLRCAAGASAR